MGLRNMFSDMSKARIAAEEKAASAYAKAVKQALDETLWKDAVRSSEFVQDVTQKVCDFNDELGTFMDKLVAADGKGLTIKDAEYKAVTAEYNKIKETKDSLLSQLKPKVLEKCSSSSVKAQLTQAFNLMSENFDGLNEIYSMFNTACLENTNKVALSSSSTPSPKKKAGA